jgi:hypothetical protein
LIWQNFPAIKNVFIDLAAGSTEYPGVCLSRIKQMFATWKIDCLDSKEVEQIFETAND